ncbi:MAG: RNA polymerase sigma factor [Planctomycetota bacterium]
MLEDTLLLRRFKSGSKDALTRLYVKYEKYLLTIATALLTDSHAAEDVVHDVFCSLIQSRETINLRGKLRSYLATCVINRARDKMRSLKRRSGTAEYASAATPDADGPEQVAIQDEEARGVICAIARLPYEQREVVVLHLQGGMKFRQIAAIQRVSTNTAKSRYQYALRRLRSVINIKENENENHPGNRRFDSVTER